MQANLSLYLALTPASAVSRDIKVENLHWVIEIAPQGGWDPVWYVQAAEPPGRGLQSHRGSESA